MGSFMDHLSGTERSCASGVARMQLLGGNVPQRIRDRRVSGIHLSVADRHIVRAVIGKRAEAVAYLNCVMDRESSIRW